MKFTGCVVVLIILLGLPTAHADFNGRDKDTVLLDFSVASAAMTAWGIARWDWFQHSPKIQHEGWFGRDTHAGGADKTGHFFMSYVLSDLLLKDFKHKGVHKPAKTAALTALATMTLLEVGDATSSKYGFSTEDLMANAAGVLASWFLATHPEWDRAIDIRMEYWPSAGFELSGDVASDYSGMRHLIAVRADAIAQLPRIPFRWLEFQAGYYTRGFRSFDEPMAGGPERHVYAGIGVNLPELFAKNKLAKNVFTYLQPPNLNVSTSHRF
ncbi:MAG: DUF2279 domain-containing protein [Pseudomonadota bacterium]